MNLGMDAGRGVVTDPSLGPSNAHMIKRALLIVGAVVGVALLGVIIWANATLPGGKMQYEIKKAPQFFTYQLTQTPAKPAAGRPVTFSFKMMLDGQPVSNRTVIIAVSHATGKGVNPRASDSLIKQTTTDANGVATITYTFGFWSLGADNGFGVALVPVATDDEAAELDRKSLAGVFGNDLLTGVGYDIPVVYPRWIGWLTWH